LVWWLAVAIAGGRQVHVDNARFDRNASILAGLVESRDGALGRADPTPHLM
jgi:hypothetical protein